MNLGKIFSNKSQQNEAIEHFRGLKDNPDWVFLVEKLIKADIEELTAEILDPDKEWSEAEQREKKRIRAYWVILSQLPEKLIEALSEQRDDIMFDGDPYFKEAKDIPK
jgi:hypothetical protein